MSFNLIGAIPVILLLLPVIYACFKTPTDKPDLPEENIIVFIAKCVGRFGCIGYMCCKIGTYAVDFTNKKAFLVVWIIISVLAVAGYWLLWVKHFKNGNHFEDMYKTGIPLFILPTCYVLLTGLLTMNIMLIVFSILDLACEYCAAYTVRKQLRDGITVDDSDEDDDDEVKSEKDEAQSEASEEVSEEEKEEIADETDKAESSDEQTE